MKKPINISTFVAGILSLAVGLLILYIGLQTGYHKGQTECLEVIQVKEYEIGKRNNIIDSLRTRDGNYFLLLLCKDRTIDKYKSSREWDNKDSLTQHRTCVLNGIYKPKD